MSPTTEHAISVKRLRRMFPEHLAEYLRDAGNGTLPQPYSPASFFLLADRIEELHAESDPKEAMSDSTTEADSQTRTIRGVVDKVETCGSIRDVEAKRYRATLMSRSAEYGLTNEEFILDHPLTVGQTYEVEVTVREVE